MAKLRVPATLFLDRDGVLNAKPVEGEYVTSPSGFQWLDGARSALQALAARGCRLVVVTNQRGVARGRMSVTDLDAIHARMNADLERDGVTLAGIYACTHEADICDCRKPGIGLFSRAMQDRPEIEVTTSAVAGDSVGDMEAANRLGTAAYLIADEARRREVLDDASQRGVRVDATFESLSALVADGFGLQ